MQRIYCTFCVATLVPSNPEPRLALSVVNGQAICEEHVVYALQDFSTGLQILLANRAAKENG